MIIAMISLVCDWIQFMSMVAWCFLMHSWQYWHPAKWHQTMQKTGGHYCPKCDLAW